MRKGSRNVFAQSLAFYTTPTQTPQLFRILFSLEDRKNLQWTPICWFLLQLCMIYICPCNALKFNSSLSAVCDIPCLQYWRQISAAFPKARWVNLKQINTKPGRWTYNNLTEQLLALDACFWVMLHIAGWCLLWGNQLPGIGQLPPPSSPLSVRLTG